MDAERDGWETELLAELADLFPEPDYDVSIVATGGNMDWLVVQAKGDPYYYSLTDGQGQYPGPDDDGILCVTRWSSRETDDDFYNGNDLYRGSDTQPLNMGVAAALIRTDLNNRAQLGPKPRAIRATLEITVHGTETREDAEIVRVVQMILDAVPRFETETAGWLFDVIPEPADPTIGYEEH